MINQNATKTFIVKIFFISLKFNLKDERSKHLFYVKKKKVMKFREILFLINCRKKKYPSVNGKIKNAIKTFKN